jgi:hypothetical protein
MTVERRPPVLAKPEPSSRASHRHEDTERFIERFAALTGIRMTTASLEALPREFRARPVPAPSVIVGRFGDELEVRTRNALCRHEPGRPQDVWTLGRLLNIRGFGAFSLLDLLEVMARHEPKGTE